MLTIWGRPNSINVQKAMWCVGELGIEHERIDAGMEHGKNKEDWFLRMNPNGLVPVIDDDGFILWESNAIVRYLSAKYGLGQLCPEDLQARADADRWMDWQVAVLAPPMTTILWNLVRTPAAERDWQVINDGVEKAATAWTIVESHLAGRDFMLGQTLSMADIPVGAMAYRWFAYPDIDRPEQPRVRAWYERLSQRPAFRQHVMLPLT